MTAHGPCKAKVAAIILNWNRKDDTLACLRSLHEQRNVEVEVIVVDNGSVDDSVFAIRDQFRDAVVIETGANLGYAGGNNVGLTYALNQGFEYVLVLNNDTILAPDCVFCLLADLQLHPDAVAAAPKSFYYDAPEIIYFAGGKIGRDGCTLHVGVGSPDGPEYDLPGETEWLSGCAILFRSRLLQEVGLFDPRYYLLY